MSRPFWFKQFCIVQDGAAMKVGVDGVLLGSWVETDACRTILDIGTGTGVLSLMMAQRCPLATIDAIEIDQDAFECSRINFTNSPFSKRLTAHLCSLQQFKSKTRYDLIISNPPFFSNGIKPISEQRRLARYNETLPLEELFESATRMLSEHGCLQLIIPFDAFHRAHAIASRNGLYAKRTCTVYPRSDKKPKRILLSYGTTKADCQLESITVANADGSYSTEYKHLTKEFYLKHDD